MRRLTPALITVSLLGLSALYAADSTAPVSVPAAQEDVQVTATRIPENAENLPTVVTVLDGAMLRERGMTDLRSALGVVAGVDIAPGGDGGPAAAVPEMWGLREFDAFLLVVDGVPWGGAFNPDLATMSLKDVARIEILRGAAPVMYGATSFIGVIHVIHNTAGTGVGTASVSAGSYSSLGVGAAVDLGSAGPCSSRIAVDFNEQGYADDRTDWERGHALWRNRVQAAGGEFRFDLDLLWLNQSPASPSPRVGTELSPDFDADTNVNPLGSHIDPRRQSFSAGYDHKAGFGSWAVLASYSHYSSDVLRGFLVADPVYPQTPAHGFRQNTAMDDIYVDGHLNFTHTKNVSVVVGADLLYGRGRTHGGDFDYVVAPDGSDAPDGGSLDSAADIGISDKRAFGGLYGYVVWSPNWRWRVDGGVRINVTAESRDASAVEFESGAFEGGTDRTNEVKPAGSVGATFTAWKKDADDVKVFAGYRNTYKPAAIDFGLEAETEILEPEKGNSYEIGVRSALFARRLELEFLAFREDLDEIVVADTGGAVPGLENGGAQRLQGFELEARGRLTDGLWARLAYSFHDAEFRDFVQDFGGVPTQLSGKRIEMSPRDMASLGVIWAPKFGFTAHGEVRYTGSRYLNKRNTALAEDFMSYSAGIGWHFKKFAIRVDGENISNQRDPVSEAELADAQYYRLPARQIWLTCNWLF